MDLLCKPSKLRGKLGRFQGVLILAASGVDWLHNEWDPLCRHLAHRGLHPCALFASLFNGVPHPLLRQSPAGATE